MDEEEYIAINVQFIKALQGGNVEEAWALSERIQHHFPDHPAHRDFRVLLEEYAAAKMGVDQSMKGGGLFERGDDDEPWVAKVEDDEGSDDNAEEEDSDDGTTYDQGAAVEHQAAVPVAYVAPTQGSVGWEQGGQVPVQHETWAAGEASVPVARHPVEYDPLLDGVGAAAGVQIPSNGFDGMSEAEVDRMMNGWDAATDAEVARQLVQLGIMQQAQK